MCMLIKVKVSGFDTYKMSHCDVMENGLFCISFYARFSGKS